MIRDPKSGRQLSDRERRILRVVETVIARRRDGDDVPDEAVIAEHAEFMPDLGEQLRALRAVEIARAKADHNATQPLTATSRHGLRGGVDLPETATLFDPDAIQGYNIMEVVGRGGMGIVYKAHHHATNRDVAIKVMLEGPLVGPRDRARFEREAQILAHLKHPNIVTIYHTGSTMAGFYLVMDFIAGQPLDVYARNRGLLTPALLELFVRICDAVSAAHVRGIIHRDLKPSNILIDDEGEPHLLDFGLATTVTEKSDGIADAHTMTMTGQFVGSMPWASPEQARGVSSGVDVRSDVYSMGVMLYQLLTQRFPYPVIGNIRDVVDHILTTEPEKPSGINARIDDEVETIVLKCLSKEPERRYQSAGELGRDLHRYLDNEPIEAKRDSGWYVLRKYVRRHRAAVSVGAAFFVLMIVFGTTMAVLYTREQHEAQRAEQTLAFLQETLFNASSQRLGADATLVEALDITANRVATDFVGQPEIEAALRYTIGAAYRTLWRHEVALHNLRIAYNLNREHLGNDHPDTIRCAVLLGMVLAESERPEAVELQRKALQSRQALYGEDHVLVAESKYQLAFALFQASFPPQLEESRRYFDEALALYRRYLGAEHPDIARCLHAYSGLHYALGRTDQAIRLIRESLAMSRKLLGDDHQFVLECMRDYSVLLRMKGEYEESERLIRSVLARTPRLFGKEHVPDVMQLLARLQHAKGDSNEALNTLSEALALWCDWLAEHPVDDRWCGRVIERLVVDQDRWAEFAESLRARSTPTERTNALNEAIDAVYEARYRRADLVTMCLSIAGIVSDRVGDRQAEPALRTAIKIVNADKHISARLRGSALYALGRCLFQQQRYADAEPVLLEAHTTLLAKLGDESSAVHSAEQLLADIRRATE